MQTNISINLLVRGSPTVKLLNTSEYYQVGKHYQLECVAIGFPQAIVWWRWFPCSVPEKCSPPELHGWIDVDPESNVSLNIMSNSEQLVPYPNNTLLYLNQLGLQVVANQSGSYRCYAQNMNGTTSYKQTPFIVTGIFIH